MKMNQVKIRNSLLLLLVATIWGLGVVAQSVGMEYVGVFTFTSVRSWMAAIVLLPCIWLLDRKKQKERRTSKNRGLKGWFKEQKELLLGGICCGLFLTIASSLQQIGVQYTSVGKAGFITVFYIIIVPILGLFFRKRCAPTVWIGVLFALAGLYFLCITGEAAAGEPLIQKGDFYVFLCALAFSGHILCVDYFSEKADAVKIACIQFFTCGIITAFPMFLLEEPSVQTIFAAWKPVLYAGILSSGVGYTLQIVGQRGINPTVASLIMSLESVVSVIGGLLILGQKLTDRELFGCVLMFIAVILAQLPDKRAAERHLKQQGEIE